MRKITHGLQNVRFGLNIEGFNQHIRSCHQNQLAIQAQVAGIGGVVHRTGDISNLNRFAGN